MPGRKCLVMLRGAGSENNGEQENYNKDFFHKTTPIHTANGVCSFFIFYRVKPVKRACRTHIRYQFFRILSFIFFSQVNFHREHIVESSFPHGTLPGWNVRTPCDAAFRRQAVFPRKPLSASRCQTFSWEETPALPLRFAPWCRFASWHP